MLSELTAAGVAVSILLLTALGQAQSFDGAVPSREGSSGVERSTICAGCSAPDQPMPRPRKRPAFLKPVGRAKPSARSTWDVSVPGPLLTFMGSAALIAGAGVASYGLETTRCGLDDHACFGRRKALLFGGLAGGTALGSVLLGVGTTLWTSDVGDAEGDFSAIAPRVSPAAITVGTFLIAGGALTVSNTMLDMTTATSNCCSTFFPDPRPRQVRLLAGMTALAVGAPLLALGKREVPRRDSVIDWTVGVGPGSLHASGSF